MIENIFKFTKDNKKTIERIIEDDYIGLNHMILPKGDALPVHNANSNVYMLVVKGIISLKLDDQEQHDYSEGHILNIPHMTKMSVFNENDDLAEIFVVKSTSPKTIK